MCKVHKKEASGSTKPEQVCPTCGGKKVIKGTCVCDAEWRGTQVGTEWSDCQCTPEELCATCKGTGVAVMD